MSGQRELAELVATTADPSGRGAVTSVRWGVVTAVTTGPNRVTVKLSGSATATPGLRYGGWYTPTVNDVVAMLVTGSDVFVLGKPA